LIQQSLETKSVDQSYEAQLLDLYLKQNKLKKNDYLEAHSHNRAVLLRDTSIFRRYSRFIPAGGRILDWGCNHAPTACLVKMLRGDAAELYGCDVHAENFQAFFDFANLRYTQLTHPYSLPYEDDFFDTVIGTAALEHAPNDSETLNELYRVLKPGGLFIMTTLPNRFSYTEWLNRRLGRPHHLRIYSLKEIKYMFLHHGFVPVESGYHQAFPSMCGTGGIFDSRFVNKFIDALTLQSGIAEKLWPIRCFSSNVFLIGKKVNSIENADFDIRKRVLMAGN
jgi:SAM-dependent methyltransferase